MATGVIPELLSPHLGICDPEDRYTWTLCLPMVFSS